MLTRYLFLHPANETTRYRYAANAMTFRFLYSGNFPNISPRPWHGAYHASELPLIFGTSSLRSASTELELQTSRDFQDLYVAFAESSVEGLRALGWEPYRPGGTALKFGDGNVSRQIIPMDTLDEVINSV